MQAVNLTMNTKVSIRYKMTVETKNGFKLSVRVADKL